MFNCRRAMFTAAIEIFREIERLGRPSADSIPTSAAQLCSCGIPRLVPYQAIYILTSERHKTTRVHFLQKVSSALHDSRQRDKFHGVTMDLNGQFIHTNSNYLTSSYCDRRRCHSHCFISLLWTLPLPGRKSVPQVTSRSDD